MYKGEREKYWYLGCTHKRQDIANPCEGVRIRYADLVELVRRDINALLARSDQDMDALAREAVRRMGSEESIDERKRQREQAEARLSVIDKMVAKLYLDNAEGRIDDDRLRRLTADLERESAGLKTTLAELSAATPGEQVAENYQRFVELARQYTHIDTLDRDTLLTFVERIEVGPKELLPGTEKVTHRNQPYRQSIRIVYKFIGELDQEPVRDLPAVANG